MTDEPVFLPQVAELLVSADLTLEQAYEQGLPLPDLAAKPECWRASTFFGWMQGWIDRYAERNAAKSAQLAIDEARLRSKRR